MLRLVKINPQANEWRFYRLDIHPTLFGEWTLTREWGRIGGGSRLLVRTVASEEEAHRLALAKAQEKQRRGYVLCSPPAEILPDKHISDAA